MGWNYRMPELCCAVALGQTERMEELVTRRCEVAKLYNDATLEFHGNLLFPQESIHYQQILIGLGLLS